MYTERRTSYRIVLRDSLAQAIHLSSGEGMCIRILNSAGGALEAGPMARRLRSSTLRFHLGAHGTFVADILLLGPAAKAEGEGLVAFRFQALRSLLARGIDHYSGSGKEAFLFLGFGDDERHARLQELGFTYVAEGWRWLTSKRVIPAYITYLHDLAALRRPGQKSQEDSQTVRDMSGAQRAIRDSSPAHYVGGTQC